MDSRPPGHTHIKLQASLTGTDNLKTHRHPGSWGAPSIVTRSHCPLSLPGAHATLQMFSATLWLTTEGLQGLRMLLALFWPEGAHTLASETTPRACTAVGCWALCSGKGLW